MLTQKRLKEVLHYDPKTGIFTWKVKIPHTTIQIGDIAGYKNCYNYIGIKIDKKLYLGHRLAWLYIYGYFPEYGIDHKDRIHYHNWITNLREATVQCNARNRGNPVTNTSGVKGVFYRNTHNRWYAHIKINLKSIHLGCYADMDEAVCARLAGEQCANWTGCDSSSPAYQYVKELLRRL